MKKILSLSFLFVLFFFLHDHSARAETFDIKGWIVMDYSSALTVVDREGRNIDFKKNSSLPGLRLSEPIQDVVFISNFATFLAEGYSLWIKPDKERLTITFVNSNQEATRNVFLLPYGDSESKKIDLAEISMGRIMINDKYIAAYSSDAIEISEGDREEIKSKTGIEQVPKARWNVAGWMKIFPSHFRGNKLVVTLKEKIFPIPSSTLEILPGVWASGTPKEYLIFDLKDFYANEYAFALSTKKSKAITMVISTYTSDLETNHTIIIESLKKGLHPIDLSHLADEHLIMIEGQAFNADRITTRPIAEEELTVNGEVSSEELPSPLPSSIQHWANDFLQILAASEYLSLADMASLNADASISRETWTSWLIKAFRNEYRTDQPSPFLDVPRESVFWASLSTAHKFNIIEDYYDDGLFEPKLPLTRAEAIVMALKAAQIEISRENNARRPFVDVLGDEWYAPYALTANDIGLMQGVQKTFDMIIQDQPNSDQNTISIFSSLSYGSKGKEVINLQKALKLQGYYFGEINGQYDEETQRALYSFQAQHKLVLTPFNAKYNGSLGEKTRKMLNQERISVPRTFILHEASGAFFKPAQEMTIGEAAKILVKLIQLK